MSFSSDLKEELSKINNLAKKEEIKSELVGYLISKNATITKNSIRYATESEYNINRFSKILKNLDINHNIEYDGKSFIITFKIKNNIDGIGIQDTEIIINKIGNINDNEKKSIIRGAFLGAGSVNNPERTYHLEINLSNRTNLEYLFSILSDMNVKCKKLNVNKKYSIYLKDGEDISELIALLGASRSVLKFEDIRVQREMKGKVNRIVNCQTANLNKTINASIEQIEAIRKLQECNKFNKLDENLKDIALLRLEYPDMPLAELGKQLKIPVGKSGVNYRLKKIIQIANDL